MVSVVGFLLISSATIPRTEVTCLIIHAISIADLEAVARHRYLQFRRGNFLLRVGIIHKYYKVAQLESDGLGGSLGKARDIVS